MAEVQGSLLYVADHRRDLLCVTEVRRHLLYDAEVWGCLLCVAEVPGGPHTHGGINMEWPRGVNCIKDGWRAYIVYITSGRRTVRLGSLLGL